ncbi:MAG: GNAT family N-acetyltransferase, partial [Chloroflexota bacterium]|nr:GNAT family N-acetyltransferase [Chloroflexota bacterium]
MEIRPARLTDLNACLAIDDSFETEYVWQMEERSSTGDIDVRFHLARLPRPMKVSGIISRDDLLYNFQHGGALFVAEDGAVRGFIDVTESAWNQVAVINNVAVAPAYRRKGVATRLMRAALDWGRQKKLRAAMLDTSTKDHPAICFYQKQGFSFCGF